MKHRMQTSQEEQIKDISCVTFDDKITLSWLWPRGIHSVYIVRVGEGCDIAADDITNDNAILYTREEYMEFNGYHESVTEVGRLSYSIYPLVKEEGEMLIIDQNGIDNHVVVSTGRVYIKYFIKERHKPFTKRKVIKIVIDAETPLNKELLCYVKKGGMMPSDIDDGVRFPFLQDFKAGENILPEIEINKDEYIRIFLTDNKAYGEIYHLMCI